MVAHEFKLGSKEDLLYEAHLARQHARTELFCGLGFAGVTGVILDQAREAYVAGSGNVLLGLLATTVAGGMGYLAFEAATGSQDSQNSANYYENFANETGQHDSSSV